MFWAAKLPFATWKPRILQLRIVGTTEADPMAEPPRISNESPVGKAILGEKAGKVVLVATPAGELRYKIVDVQHKPNKNHAAAKIRKAVK